MGGPRRSSSGCRGLEGTASLVSWRKQRPVWLAGQVGKSNKKDSWESRAGSGQLGPVGF